MAQPITVLAADGCAAEGRDRGDAARGLGTASVREIGAATTTSKINEDVRELNVPKCEKKIEQKRWTST